jgi:hypothetical protein
MVQANDLTDEEEDALREVARGEDVKRLRKERK